MLNLFNTLTYFKHVDVLRSMYWARHAEKYNRSAWGLTYLAAKASLFPYLDVNSVLIKHCGLEDIFTWLKSQCRSQKILWLRQWLEFTFTFRMKKEQKGQIQKNNGWVLRCVSYWLRPKSILQIVFWKGHEGNSNLQSLYSVFQRFPAVSKSFAQIDRPWVRCPIVKIFHLFFKNIKHLHFSSVITVSC